MTQVNIHIAKAHFSELIKKALLGEEIIIARDNKPIIKLVPLNQPTSKRKIGLHKGRIKIKNDFDEPLEDFKGYYE
jgi:prevent-host-death family protein